MPKKAITSKKSIGKYDEREHAKYVALFGESPVALVERHLEIDPRYIRCVAKPTKKMVEYVIGRAAKTEFAHVAKFADAAQQLEAVKACPGNLAHIAAPSVKVIEAAFEHGTAWFKKHMTREADVEVQLAAVKADPQLIKWCINPHEKALAHAIAMDKSLLWVAMDKKAKVLELIEKLKLKPKAARGRKKKQ